jgi:hypothetical protein
MPVVEGMAVPVVDVVDVVSMHDSLVSTVTAVDMSVLIVLGMLTGSSTPTLRR